MKRVAIILSLVTIIMINFHCSSSKNAATTSDNLNPNAYYKFNRRDYKGAMDICNEALKQNSNNYHAFILRGCCYLVSKNYNLAYNDFDSAIKIKPTNGIAIYDRANAESNLKMYKEAVEDYGTAISLDKYKANSFYAMGTIEENIFKNYIAALSDFDSCLKWDGSNHLFVHGDKATIYSTQNKYEEATKELTDFIKKDPQQVTMALNSLNITKKMYDFKKDAYLKDSSFIKAYNVSYNAYTMLGEMYKIWGKYKMADTYYELGKQYSLPKASCFYGKSELAYDDMDYDLAIENIDSAIAYNPWNINFYTFKGYILTAKKDYKRAMWCFEKAIKFDYSKGNSYFYRGETDLAMGNYQKAIEDFNASQIDNYECSPNAILNIRGYAYFKNKQYKEAIADYDSAIKVANSGYQPYWQYRQEAVDALNGNGTNFCTVIHWLSPIDDANGLFDDVKFHISVYEPLKINLKVITNHPITKDSIVTNINGIAFFGEAKLFSKKKEESTNYYEYQFTETLKLPQGTHPLQVTCGNKSSQKINMVVE